jgi:hypothetical protein
LKEYLQNKVTRYVATYYPNKKQVTYAVIASSKGIVLRNSTIDIPFERKIEMLDEELNNRCYLVNVIQGNYEEHSVLDNYAVIEEICWDIANLLPEDWHETFNELIYLANRIRGGKRLNISFEEQSELELRFKEFLNARHCLWQLPESYRQTVLSGA